MLKYSKKLKLCSRLLHNSIISKWHNDHIIKNIRWTISKFQHCQCPHVWGPRQYKYYDSVKQNDPAALIQTVNTYLLFVMASLQRRHNHRHMYHTFFRVSYFIYQWESSFFNVKTVNFVGHRLHFITSFYLACFFLMISCAAYWINFICFICIFNWLYILP